MTEYIDAMKGAAKLSFEPQLRRLSITLLISYTISKPVEVWCQTWNLLADDIIYKKRNEFKLPSKITIFDSWGLVFVYIFNCYYLLKHNINLLIIVLLLL